METEGGKLSIDDSSRDLMRTLFENQNRALDFKEQRGDDREETDFHSLHGGVDLDPNEEATFLNSNEDKAKTSLRMNYEAQAKVIERQTGGLEAIRLQLGLSQRKMAQLLLVDPSAWTRWMKTSPPPHILRSLQ